MLVLRTLAQDRDLWRDADMQSVVAYLRGNRNLKVPSEMLLSCKCCFDAVGSQTLSVLHVSDFGNLRREFLGM